MTDVSHFDSGVKPTDIEYLKFKHLLEYFVAHLEYVANKNTTFRGYETYIRPLVEAGTFKNTGKGFYRIHGYKSDQIQQQVSKWSHYSIGDIAFNCSYQRGNVRTRLCYLNWAQTSLNVNAQWGDDLHISTLSLQEHIPAQKTWVSKLGPILLEDLGLYDGQAPNKSLKDFCNAFFAMATGKTLKQYTSLLEKNYNLILTGAPGTGKTFLARQIAKALTGDDDSTPANQSHIAFVQFHPSYDYTDFVEGLRPVAVDEKGNVSFARCDGIFKEFCRQAIKKQKTNFQEAYQSLLRELEENYSKEHPLELQTDKASKPFRIFRNSQNGLGLLTANSGEVQGSLTAEKTEAFLTDTPYPYWAGYYCGVINYLKKQHHLVVNEEKADQKYVFIIDEINRGDIARIFGELFFALDPGYRGEKGRVMTQYSNLVDDNDLFKSGFYIPENVYVIGTMNDIDRNVDSMDFAIRRRFTWKEIKPEDNLGMWDAGIPEYKEIAAKYMQAVNETISDIAGLGKSYQLGPAYFLKLRESEGNFTCLWEYHIQPLLKEYLRGLPNAGDAMEKLEKAWQNASRDAEEEADSALAHNEQV